MSVQTAPADQQQQHQIMFFGIASGPLNVAMLAAEAGSANVYQFNQDYQMVFGVGLCDFRQGGIYGLHAPLEAALLAAGAPMTLV